MMLSLCVFICGHCCIVTYITYNTGQLSLKLIQWTSAAVELVQYLRFAFKHCCDGMFKTAAVEYSILCQILITVIVLCMPVVEISLTFHPSLIIQHLCITTKTMYHNHLLFCYH